MTMTLMHSTTSPYVRKVDILLAEAGMSDQVTRIDGSGTPFAPNAGTLEANPLGKVPALIREDGPALYDSRVICRYLDSLAGGRFYPASRIWEVMTLEATADGILDAALLMVYERRLRPEDKQMEDVVEAQWAKIDRALDVLEDRWISHLQAPLNMGHIAVGAALGYLDLRHDGRGWRGTRPELAKWFATFDERPSMVETRPTP